MRFFIFYITLLFNNLPLHAQEDVLRPVFENLVDEFSGSEVYDLYQDKNGYMWFTTDAGIEKYDGEKIITYDLNAYCNASVAFNFFVESNEKVWFNTINNDLLWFNPLKKTFNPHFYKFNNQLKEELNKYHIKTFIRNIYFGEKEMYFTFLKSNGYVKQDSKGKCNTIRRIELEFKNQALSKLYISISDSLNYTFFEKNPIDKNVSIIIDGDTNEIIKEENFQKTWFYGIADIEENSIGKFIGFGTNVILVKDSIISYQNLKFDVLDILLDNNHILVSTFNGVYVLDKDLTIVDHLLKGYSVTSSYIDAQSNYWFSTIEKGVFFTRNLRSKQTYFLKKISPTNIKKINKYFLVMNNNTELYILNKKMQFVNHIEYVFYFNKSYSSRFKIKQDILINFIPENNFVSKLYKDTILENEFIIAKKKIQWYKSRKLKRIDVFEFNQSLNSHVQIKDSNLLVLSNKGLYDYKITNGKITRSNIKHDSTLNYKSGFELDKYLLLISNKGLHGYSKNENGYTVPDFFVEQTGINGYNKINNSLSYLYFQKNLVQISISNHEIKYSIIDLSNTIPSKKILSLEVDSNYFYFGTKKGITRLEKQDLTTKTNTNKYFFIVDSLFINNQMVQPNDTLFLPYNSSLTIYYNYINYFSDYTIEYQLDESKWFQNGGSNLRIEQFEKGYHHLKIRVNKGKNSVVVLEQTIFVKTPYWDTFWFKLIIFLIGISLIFVLVRLYIHRQNSKQKKQLEKLNLELKFLTAQMNPHFTFNTISSIQSYIINNKKNDAIQYLSDYAHLMRKSLDYSFEETISIQKEIEFINTYISLENRRFQKKYLVNYLIDEQIDLEQYKIPCFLIQPLIENIINHAQYGKDERHQIDIHIENAGDFIIIKVVDFGEGIKKNQTLNSHKSYGLDILMNRLKIHNKSKFEPSHLSFEFTNKKSKKGTTVTMKLLKT